jgi:hypothetical protein
LRVIFGGWLLTVQPNVLDSVFYRIAAVTDMNSTSGGCKSTLYALASVITGVRVTITILDRVVAFYSRPILVADAVLSIHISRLVNIICLSVKVSGLVEVLITLKVNVAKAAEASVVTGQRTPRRRTTGGAL